MFKRYNLEYVNEKHTTSLWIMILDGIGTNFIAIQLFMLFNNLQLNEEFIIGL